MQGLGHKDQFLYCITRHKAIEAADILNAKSLKPFIGLGKDFAELVIQGHIAQYRWIFLARVLEDKARLYMYQLKGVKVARRGDHIAVVIVFTPHQVI